MVLTDDPIGFREATLPCCSAVSVSTVATPLPSADTGRCLAWAIKRSLVTYVQGGDGWVCGVERSDGRVRAADVVGIGAQPHTELAEELGLQVQGGVVDGRAARLRWARRRRGRLHDVARPERCGLDAVRVRHCRHRGGEGDGCHAVRAGTALDEFLRYEAGRLVAAECVNRPADFMAARSAIRAGSSIDPARAPRMWAFRSGPSSPASSPFHDLQQERTVR